MGATAASTRPHGRLPPSLLPTLVVVDDLPYAAGPEQRQQIAGALGDLAAGARFPVVVIATETSGKAQQERGLSAAAGSFQGMHKVGGCVGGQVGKKEGGRPGWLAGRVGGCMGRQCKQVDRCQLG